MTSKYFKPSGPSLNASIGMIVLRLLVRSFLKPGGRATAGSVKIVVVLVSVAMPRHSWPKTWRRWESTAVAGFSVFGWRIESLKLCEALKGLIIVLS